MREVKRLDAITRSPVYTSVGEAIGGLSTIRYPAVTVRQQNLSSNIRVGKDVSGTSAYCLITAFTHSYVTNVST